MINYVRTREDYEALEAEALSLKRNFEAAVKSGDYEEVVRLTGRLKDLPGEMLAKRVQAYQEEIEFLEDKLVEAKRQHAKAKQNIKNPSMLVTAKIQALDNKRAGFNNATLMALADVRIAESEMDIVEKEIRSVEKQLKELLSQKI